MRDKWVSTIEMVFDCKIIVTKNSAVCSCHFPTEAYQTKQGSVEKKDRLELNAVPSLFVKHDEICVISEYFYGHNDAPAASRELPTSSSEFINSPVKKRKISDLKQLSESDIMCMNVQELQEALKKAIISLKDCTNAKKKIYDKLMYIQENSKTSRNVDDENTDSELIRLILNGKVKEKFHPKVQDFSKQLKYISEKGYSFLRNSIGKERLPCVRTIKYWTAKNNGAPGITAQNLDLLAEQLNAHNGPEPALALIMDEMNIMSKLRYVSCEDKVYGHVDFGDEAKITIDPVNPDQSSSPNDSDGTSEKSERKVAKNALFYLVNGINIKLKLPIAYVLIDKLSGIQKAELTRQIINLIYIRGKGKIKVVTLDGDPAHFTMAENLGATFKIDDENGKINATFRVDGLDWDIHIMLDLNHMLKLLRNNQESRGTFHLSQRLTDIFSESQLKELLGRFYNNDVVKHLKNDRVGDRKIEWKHLIKLHEYQETTKIRLNNKITRHHINFRSKIMNVRLCAQTLHDNTAESMLHCEYNLGLQDFSGSIYTAIAFKIFHRIFSIFNSMFDDAKGWNSPVNAENVDEIIKFLEAAEVFVRSLKLSDKKYVIQTKIKTGFLGIIIGIDVLKKLATEFIKSGKWNKMLLYPTSQDHIEIFFGFIRLRLGCNDNPDAYILECVYKSILGLKAMHVTGKGNCELQVHESQLCINSTQKKTNNIGFTVRNSWKVQASSEKNKLPGRTRKAKSIAQISLDDSESFTQSAVNWNSFVVQQKIEKDIDCEQCLENLHESEPKAHFDVVEICRKAEFIIDLHLNRMSEKFNSARIELKVLSMLTSDILSEVCNHSHDKEDILDAFRINIVKKIIKIYIDLRAREKFKRISDNLHEEFVRQRHKKLTLFSNQ